MDGDGHGCDDGGGDGYGEWYSRSGVPPEPGENSPFAAAIEAPRSLLIYRGALGFFGFFGVIGLLVLMGGVEEWRAEDGVGAGAVVCGVIGLSMLVGAVSGIRRVGRNRRALLAEEKDLRDRQDGEEIVPMRGRGRP